MSTKNFVSYGDAETLFTGVGAIASNVRLNTQDLTTPSRTKNLFPITLKNIKRLNTIGTWNGNSYTIAGTTFNFVLNSTGEIQNIALSGTSENNWNSRVILCEHASFSSGDYKVSAHGAVYASYLNLEINDTVISIQDSNDHEMTYANDFYVDAVIIVRPSTNVDNYHILPMIRKSTETDATFAPYIPSVESRIEDLESDVNVINSNLTNLHFEAIDTNISVTTTDTSTEIASISGYSAFLFVAKVDTTVRGSLYIPYYLFGANVDCYIIAYAGTDINSIYVKRVDDTHLIVSTTLQTLNTLDIYGIK